jgi:hypothetical protein
MNIIVLHGDNYLKSYERLNAFKAEAARRGWEYLRISEPTNLLAASLTSQSLFAQDRLVVVEASVIAGNSFFKWVSKNHRKFMFTLVIYSDKKLPDSFIKQLPEGIRVEESKLSNKIWDFLESLYPGNSKACMSMLHSIEKKQPIELIFSSIVRQICDLYWISVSERTSPYTGFRLDKLKKQAKRFRREELACLIDDLAKIDVKSKSSAAQLIDLLDIWISHRLK